MCDLRTFRDLFYNVRLAAVRRLVFEAADAGLLSPELAARIRRVKGARKLGVRLGNWLTAEEARRLWQSPGTGTLKGKRDTALLAILLGCGLRRRELAELTLDLLQRREDHWAIVDLVGKGGHIEGVPIIVEGSQGRRIHLTLFSPSKVALLTCSPGPERPPGPRDSRGRRSAGSAFR